MPRHHQDSLRKDGLWPPLDEHSTEKGLNLYLQIAVSTFTGETKFNCWNGRSPVEVTFVLQVKPSYTIATVKDIIERRKGFLRHQHNLWSGGQILDDSRTLFDYNIQNKSFITMVREFPKIVISISSLLRPTFTVEGLMESDTVDALKARIQVQTDIPSDSQSLTYKWHELRDNFTLLDYGIGQHSTVYLS